MLTPLGPNRRLPFHVVITIYDNDVNVMSRCAVVLLHRHCTFDTTEKDMLITKIAHINTSLNVHSLHQDTRKRLYVKQCKACKLNCIRC